MGEAGGGSYAITGTVKQDKEGRRLCEYPYCKNYAESKGVRNGERRYRPWCEKHRFVKVRPKSGVKPRPGSKAKAKTQPAAKASVKRGAPSRSHR